MLQETRRFSRMRSGAGKLALLEGRATELAVVTLLDNISHPTANCQTPPPRGCRTRNNDCMPLTVSTGQF